MRDVLAQRDGCRIRCHARIERFGSKPSYKGPPIKTLLLVSVRCVKTGEELTDHVWMRSGKWSERINVGDVIEFDARSASYEKGYRGRRDDDCAGGHSVDFGLCRPTRVRILTATADSFPFAGPDLFTVGREFGEAPPRGQHDA